MATYISHISAALLWEIPQLHVVFGYPSVANLKDALFVEQVTASCEAVRVRQTTVQSHVASLPLPRGAVVERNGKKVACPELVFLELAFGLEFHRLVLLGMQLCSSKVGGEPITNASKIQRFLAKAKGHKGHRAATSAANYLVDGSASVMESLLYMLLTLPYARGGFGLSGVALNQKISLESKETSLVNKNVFVDLLWSKASVAVEYDSYEYHNNRDSWMKDARRLAAIERLGYRVLSVNTTQLYSPKALAEVAQVIASHLNKRIRIRTDRFAAEHSKLRKLLPRSS